MSQIVVYNTGGGGGGGFIKTVTGNMGGGIPPDGSGNVNIVGGHDIVIHGTANTLTVDVKNSIILGDLSPITGNDAATFNTGDLSIIHGSIKLPSTTADSLEGVIYVNGDPFISDFGTMDNVFIGRLSGNFTNTGSSNVGVGAGTFFSLTTGTSNVAVGAGALVLLTSSTDNVAIGMNALEQLATGTGENVGLGSSVLSGLQTGRNNIAVGFQAGNLYTGAESSNILIGSPGVLADSNTIRIGVQGSSDGQQNATYMAGIVGVTVSSPAAVVIDTVTGQLGVGAPGTGPIETVTADTGGPLGPTAGNINILGAHGINTSGSVSTVTVAINNAITLGDLASIVGSPALTATTGDVTISAGNLNLPNTVTAGNEGVITFGGDRFVSNFGSENTFVGQNSGNTTLTGSGNTALGEAALTNITGGIENTAIGDQALFHLTSSPSNTVVGYAAALSISTGNGQNVIVGANGADSLTTGTSNILIGTEVGNTYTSTESSNILIGNDGINAENNTIRIGSTGGGVGDQNRCFIAGIDGVNVGSVARVVTEASDQLGTAVLTAGANITITPAANTITIATSGMASFAWSVITASQSAAVNNGYIVNGAGTVVLTLPTTSVVGSVIEVTGINNATGWQVAQNASQIIHYGTSTTTTGVGGSLTSSATRDSIKMVCVVANLEWNVLSSIGNITVV